VAKKQTGRIERENFEAYPDYMSSASGVIVALEGVGVGLRQTGDVVVVRDRRVKFSWLR
jgi:hypothetical protein